MDVTRIRIIDMIRAWKQIKILLEKNNVNVTKLITDVQKLIVDATPLVADIEAIVADFQAASRAGPEANGEIIAKLFELIKQFASNPGVMQILLALLSGLMKK